MSTALVRFLDSFARKYGRSMPKVSGELVRDGRVLVKYGDETTKGMKWMKYFDQESGELVGWEQSFKDQAKMGRYDISDVPVILRFSKNGSVNIPGQNALDSYRIRENLYSDINDFKERLYSPFDELYSNRPSWLF